MWDQDKKKVDVGGNLLLKSERIKNITVHEFADTSFPKSYAASEAWKHDVERTILTSESHTKK